jgi:hypothetical protein
MSQVGRERVRERHNVALEAQKLGNLFRQTVKPPIADPVTVPQFSHNTQTKVISTVISIASDSNR